MATQKWSQDVTSHSDALDLDRDVFTRHDPKAIAASLKKSAEASHRRRATPFRSAMSMLTFYINRAGTDLDPKQKRVLEKAKEELRIAFGNEASDLELPLAQAARSLPAARACSSKNRPMVATTLRCPSSESSGYIGSARVSRAADSATGKSPGLWPSEAKQTWRWSGIG